MKHRKLMKQKKFLILIAGAFLFSLSVSAKSIHYYQSLEDQSIKEITPKEFDQCLNIIYRTASKSELSRKHKKHLLAALIKGEAVNDLTASLAKLKAAPGTCTYGEAGEEFN